MHFIYVMDEKSKDKLLANGYTLLKHNEKSNVWCFENKLPDQMAFDLDINCVFSDMLTF